MSFTADAGTIAAPEWRTGLIRPKHLRRIHVCGRWAGAKADNAATVNKPRVTAAIVNGSVGFTESG